MMKKLIAVLAVLLVAGPLRAETKRRLTLSIEAYGTGGINDTFEKNTKEVVDSLNSVGVRASGSTKTDPGYGFRIGIVFPQPNDFELGGSIGGVTAPKIVQTLDNGPFTY